MPPRLDFLSFFIASDIDGINGKKEELLSSKRASNSFT